MAMAPTALRGGICSKSRKVNVGHAGHTSVWSGNHLLWRWDLGKILDVPLELSSILFSTGGGSGLDGGCTHWQGYGSDERTLNARFSILLSTPRLRPCSLSDEHSNILCKLFLPKDRSQINVHTFDGTSSWNGACEAP